MKLVEVPRAAKLTQSAEASAIILALAGGERTNGDVVGNAFGSGWQSWSNEEKNGVIAAAVLLATGIVSVLGALLFVNRKGAKRRIQKARIVLVLGALLLAIRMMRIQKEEEEEEKKKKKRKTGKKGKLIRRPRGTGMMDTSSQMAPPPMMSGALQERNSMAGAKQGTRGQMTPHSMISGVFQEKDLRAGTKQGTSSQTVLPPIMSGALQERTSSQTPPPPMISGALQERDSRAGTEQGTGSQSKERALPPVMSGALQDTQKAPKGEKPPSSPIAWRRTPFSEVRRLPEESIRSDSRREERKKGKNHDSDEDGL